MDKPKKKANAALHKGHKKRLREKFLRSGDFSYFYDHEILEMLLSYSIVRKDTNPIAHTLIKKFGSLSGVIEASVEELMSVPEIGERTATFLKMQYELIRAYTESKYKITAERYSEDTIIPYLRGEFFGRTNEFLYIVCIDARGKVICCKQINQGLSEIKLDLRKIFMDSFYTATRSVVVAHNHPNGILKPSQDDIVATKELQTYLEKIGIKLMDHFIFTDKHWMSIINDHSFKINNIMQGEEE